MMTADDAHDPFVRYALILKAGRTFLARLRRDGAPVLALSLDRTSRTGHFSICTYERDGTVSCIAAIGLSGRLELREWAQRRLGDAGFPALRNAFHEASLPDAFHELLFAEDGEALILITPPFGPTRLEVGLRSTGFVVRDDIAAVASALRRAAAALPVDGGLLLRPRIGAWAGDLSAHERLALADRHEEFGLNDSILADWISPWNTLVLRRSGDFALLTAESDEKSRAILAAWRLAPPGAA